MPRLFAYGSLVLPEVMEALVGRALPARPARLPGYERFLVRGRPYPGIVPAPAASTEGVLYGEVDAEALALLDRFEGPLYGRREVRVRRPGASPLAWAYVVREAHRHRLGREPWDAKRFRERHLEEYAAHCAGLRRSFRPGFR